MEFWAALFDILVLLSTALVLGVLCGWLRQSPILGYLAAGTLLGPNALEVISSTSEVDALAELGIALLLFTIGLEFSWRRLMNLGSSAIGGGVVQVVVTLGLGTVAAAMLGQSVRTSLVIGAIIALSSTACVLRLLGSRAEIDSAHGRHALGVLLVQDAAVVPLVLMVTILGGHGEAAQAGWVFIKTLGGAALLVALLYVLLSWVIPRVLHLEFLRGNRELPILLAIVIGLGSTWGSHALGLSPSLGAFIAGMLMAASPFAAQVRADISSIRTLLVTLFFSSVGMLGDPTWFVQNIVAVCGLVLAVVIGKALIVYAVLKAFRVTHQTAFSAGICLAQIGEFSFVLAAAGRGVLLDDEAFRLVISSTILSLFVTPYLVAGAPRAAQHFVGALRRAGLIRAPEALQEGVSDSNPPRLIIIGFGPAGQSAARRLQGQADNVAVVDLSLARVRIARDNGFSGHYGDARHADVLRHVGLNAEAVVVITVPDPASAIDIVRMVRSLAPNVPIIVRSRYQRFIDEIKAAGADEVIDEEHLVGARIGAHLRKRQMIARDGD